jgi:ssDNA-binding Zn-finger/Zn-ribbon topoisomerase 1
MMYEYEGVPRIVYGEGATFIPVCPKCGRFVKADETIRFCEAKGIEEKPNATCSKDGRINMIFEGYI